MNAQKEYFVYLLRCFLSGETPKGRQCDFEELYRLADIHNVSGIIATQLKAVEEAYRPSGEMRSRFMQTIGLTLLDSERKAQAQEKVKALLTQRGIRHLFVKGNLIAASYPVPALRASGDIDVIVAPESLPEVLAMAADSDGDITVIDYTTHMAALNVDGADVEFHDNADVSLPYFDDIFSLCTRQEGCTAYLSDEDHLLYVMAHLAKHIAYRGAGIKMLMDVDAPVRSCSGFDTEAFLARCRQADILKTAEGLLSLSALWFGTPVTATVDFRENPSLLNAFEHVLLDGGSFGYEENAVPLRYMDMSGSQSVTAKIRTLLKMAFPSRAYLKKSYPYYAHHAMLYPVARIHRLFDGLFKKRRAAENAVKQVTSGAGGTAYQLELIRELDINFNR